MAQLATELATERANLGGNRAGRRDVRMNPRKLKTKARGGWSGGPVPDNTDTVRLAHITVLVGIAILVLFFLVVQ